MRSIRAILSILVFAVLAAALCGGCSANSGSSGSDDQDSSRVSPVSVRVASLKGPTTLGIVDFIHDVQTGSSEVNASYEFEIFGLADEIVPRLLREEIDIALLPANLASILYQKTEGDVTAISINTLGVLHVVSADTSIRSIDDLSGKTVLLTGKGTTPEFVLKALLEHAGLSDSVTLEFKSEATELAALLLTDPDTIAVLPEPYVTSVIAQNPDLTRCIDLNEPWKEAMGEEMVTGVTVVRNSFASEHPDVSAEFISKQAESVASINANPQASAKLIVELGIISNEAIAAESIPGCNLVCLIDEEMESSLSHYLSALFNQSPDAIGGVLPAEDFYYRSS